MPHVKKTLFNLLLFIISGSVTAQGIWQVTELADMPERVSNNAVATNGSHVYSFMGIDSTKFFSGIHAKAFVYDIAANNWDTLADVPIDSARIASAASEIKGIIYIIGGYYVSPSSEFSSKKLFIYDPGLNSYQTGADLPVATDDHVQCTWKDSLIYVISGWYNDSNITLVQIYNAALDVWSAGTPLPAGSDYEAFGASGVIIDNTIYFAGGVKDGPFSMLPKVRVGVIDPADPTNIAWSIADDSLALLYRSGPAILNEKPIWFGGADKAYNFNGIEYGTGVGVEPQNFITSYDPISMSFSTDSLSVSIMDMRGIAQIDSNRYIIAGGMGPGQVVSNKTYLLEYVIPPGVTETPKQFKLSVYPNPTSTRLQVQFIGNGILENWNISDITGRVVSKDQTIPNDGIEVFHLQNGLYTLQVKTSKRGYTSMFVVNK